MVVSKHVENLAQIYMSELHDRVGLEPAPFPAFMRKNRTELGGHDLKLGEAILAVYNDPQKISTC